MSDSPDQVALRRLYDALRDEHAETYNRPIGNSPAYDAGVRKGLDMAIDVLVRLNGGYAPPESR